MNRACFLEIDLYWFQGGAPGDRIRQLFDRLAPLWNRDPSARKGLALCVGWLFDSVLYWNGDPDGVIATCQPPTYEPWTYARLGTLVGEIRQEAGRRSLADFHVALILLGGETMEYDADATCEGWSGRTEERTERAHYNIRGRWFPEHPEIDRSRFGTLDFGSRVRVPVGEQTCTSPEPTLSEYFTSKFAGFRQVTGFDTIVFRDGVFMPAYRRGNRDRYMDPETARAHTDSLVDLLTRLKTAMPDIVLIGYDSGTSSMEEWRSHGFDLERTAASGCLDLWITQTWASAWQDYWPAHSMGYTFQLANLLVDLAMLAGTPCRSLFLIETFDAWEPWDSIHQYPGKVDWEIWAYSHAALRRPGGVVAGASGCYISWMNRGPDLIPAETVQHLCNTLDRCQADLARGPVPGGPCLVYHRPGLESLLNHPEPVSRGEEMDDWTAMIMKYGVPVLSITRSEWLEDIQADGFLVPAPACLDPVLETSLETRLRQGIPILFMGRAALLPERLRRSLAIRTREDPVTGCLASFARVSGALARRIGATGLQVLQRQRTLDESPDWETAIEGLGGPVLSRHRSLPCVIWETPEWGTPMELHLTTRSVGSLQLYLSVSEVFGADGWGPSSLRWTGEDWQKPACFHFWRYPDGTATVLLGNLETGTTGSSQFAIKGLLQAAGRPVGPHPAHAAWPPGWIRPQPGGFRIALAPHRMALVLVGGQPSD